MIPILLSHNSGMFLYKGYHQHKNNDNSCISSISFQLSGAKKVIEMEIPKVIEMD